MEGGDRPARKRTLEILWLEDDEVFLDNALGLLEAGADEQDGMTRFRPVVHRVATLREALAALRGNPGLIVTDLNVPDSAGADTLMALRRAAPGTPVLVLTVVTDMEATMMAAMEDAEFLDKDDLSPERLWRAVFMAIMRANAHATLR